VESLFAASLHISDFVQTQNEAKILTISATATWKFAEIRKIGWGWIGVIWIYNILTYFLLDPLKFAIRYAISGRAWDLVVDQKVSETKQLKY
jgi:H+-transporting ATPase